MSKRLNWWWVVATHERGTVRKAEYDALGMIDFLNSQTAARVFTSKRMAEAWLTNRKRLNGIPEGIELQIVSDEAWGLVKDMYYRGKNYGAVLL